MSNNEFYKAVILQAEFFELYGPNSDMDGTSNHIDPLREVHFVNMAVRGAFHTLKIYKGESVD
jgi:hypothetical protein